MSQPRKQHYLPQFYLRGFSLDGRGIHQLEKATGKHYGCQIKDTAAIKDFHVLDFDGAEDPHALEKHLSNMEGEFARHLATLLTEGVQSELARLNTIQLLSLMRLRVPAFKEHIEASYPSTLRKTAEILERQGELPPVPAGSEEKLRIENIQFSVLNWKTMEIIFKLAANEDLLSVLYGMRCVLYTAPPGMAFITCDQPVSTFHPRAADTPYGIGPQVPGVELTLPLSSRKLLHLSHSRSAHAEAIARPAQVAEFNRRTVTMAQRYIFAASHPENYVELAASTMGVRTGFVFDDLDHGDGLVQLHRYIAIGPGPSAQQ